MYKKLLKFGFFLLYNHLAFTYDFIAWLVSLGQWSTWREAAIKHLEADGRVLELAYGTGGLFATMTRRGLAPTGIDLSPYMARCTARRLSKAQLPQEIMQAQAQNLPFPAKHFTYVVATFPTNYIFQPETLAEIHRVLVDPPEAKLIIVWQGHLERPKFVVAAINRLYSITGQQYPSVSHLLAPFEAAGFEAAWQIKKLEKSSLTLLIARKSFA